MLSYHYYVEYLSRILDSYSYYSVVKYSFVKTDSTIGINHFSCLLWFCTHAQSHTSLCHHLLPMLHQPSPL